MNKEWQSAPPNIGDFEAPNAIYVVRGAQLNYPIPVLAHKSASLKSGAFITFEFLCDDLHGLFIAANSLQNYWPLAGLQWFGPVDYPE